MRIRSLFKPADGRIGRRHWISAVVVAAATMALIVPAAALGADDITSVNPGLTAKLRHYFEIEAHKAGVVPPADFKLLAGSSSPAALAELKKEEPKLWRLVGASTFLNSDGDCETAVTAFGRAQTTENLDELLAHEAFHCVEDALVPENSAGKASNWVWEGLASWVGMTEVPSRSSFDAHQLETWYENPDQDVLTSSLSDPYYASGFWGRVEDSFHNVWGLVRTVVPLSAEGEETEAFDAATEDQPKFFENWGSSVFADGSLGSEWTSNSPLRPLRPSTESTTLSYPKKLQFETEQHYAARRYRISFTSKQRPVLHLVLDRGYGRLQTGHDPTGLSERWFCEAGRSCTCPAGKVPIATGLDSLEDNARLGITSDADTTHGDVEFLTLKQFCQGELRVSGSLNGVAYRPGACSLSGSQGYISETIDFLFDAKNPATLPLGAANNTSELDLTTTVTPPISNAPGEYDVPPDDEVNPPREYDSSLTQFVDYGNFSGNPTFYDMLGGGGADPMHLNSDLRSGTMQLEFGTQSGRRVTISGPFVCKADKNSPMPFP